MDAIQEGAIFAENNEQKQLELEDEAGALLKMATIMRSGILALCGRTNGKPVHQTNLLS